MTRFAQGIGRLDARKLNALLRAENDVAREPGPPVGFRTRYYGPIVCEINGGTQLSGLGKRYLYDVREIRFDDDYLAQVVQDGFEHDRVVNLAEFGNTATTESGLTIENLPGSYRIQRIPNDTVVPVFVAPTGNATRPFVAWFDRAGEFDGNCAENIGGPDEGGGGGTTYTPVQAFTGTWSGLYQYNGTQTSGTKQVIDLAIGAERWAANSIRFWNGSEATNAGATLQSGRYRFATAADCRAWWDLYTVRVNINSEGWQYLNTSNSGSATVDGSSQPAYVNTSPAVTWSGSDFAAGLTMDVEVYELATGGGP